MASINKVILVGHLGKDPQVRVMNSGGKVVSFSIATGESWVDKQSGEKREKTEWHPVVIFNEGLAGIAEKYLKKGSKAYIEGQLQTRKYTDQSGADKYITEVVLQRFRGELVLLSDANTGGENGRQAARGASSPYNDARNQAGPGTSPGKTGSYDPALDDDIPL